MEPQILLDIIDRHLLDRAPRTIRRLPDNLALAIGQLQRLSDLVGMEIIDLLLFPFRLVNPRQRRIATRIVEIQNALPRRLLTQHSQALPEEVLLLRRAFDFSGSGNPPPRLS
ncbi:hypothetical protein D3C73_1452630 [compost metagenome]